MGSRDRCKLVIQILMTVTALCVFEPVMPHSSAESTGLTHAKLVSLTSPCSGG